MPLSDVMFCLHSGITICLQSLIQCNWCNIFVCLFSGALYHKIELKTCPVPFQKNESAVKFSFIPSFFVAREKERKKNLARKKFKINHKLEHQHTILHLPGTVFTTLHCLHNL